MGAPSPAERTRYLDWCSAQILRRIDALSPEAAWRMAHGDQAEPTGEPWPVVRRLTEVLARELPTFEQWLALAAEDPERVERDLIGFERTASPPALTQFLSAPDPPAWEVLSRTWWNELPSASRLLVPPAEGAEETPAHLAEQRARARVWALLRRVSGWPAAPARLLLDALTTELRLWRLTGSGERPELERWLERTEERFLASAVVEGEGVVFPIRVPPLLSEAFSWADAVVTDGRRHGIRSPEGRVEWFENDGVDWSAEEPPPFPENHPLFRVLYDFARRYGVQRAAG